MSNIYYPERSRLGRFKKQLKRELSEQANKKIFFDSFAKVKYSIFNGMDEQTCSKFGCGRTLTITEQLFGNKCIHHSIPLAT